MIRILTGISTAEMGRRAAFYDYLHVLQQPVGAMTMFVHGQSIAKNRNIIVRQALDTGCSHVFFLDDDTAFKPDILIKLLCHNVDIVTGLHLQRNYPHRPLIYDEIDSKGAHIRYLRPEDKGLMKIEASGLGACLIKCKVFSKLEEPWFRYGEVDGDGLGEDLGFFKRVKELGLQHHCDLDCIIGHMSNTIVWPQKSESGWSTVYDTNGEGNIAFPQLVSPELVNK